VTSPAAASGLLDRSFVDRCVVLSGMPEHRCCARSLRLCLPRQGACQQNYRCRNRYQLIHSGFLLCMNETTKNPGSIRGRTQHPMGAHYPQVGLDWVRYRRLARLPAAPRPYESQLKLNSGCPFMRSCSNIRLSKCPQSRATSRARAKARAGRVRNSPDPLPQQIVSIPPAPSRRSRHGLMRFVPVVSRARIHLERHRQRKRRHGRFFHDFLDNWERALDLAVRHLEHQLIVHLQQHLR